MSPAKGFFSRPLPKAGRELQTALDRMEQSVGQAAGLCGKSRQANLRPTALGLPSENLLGAFRLLPKEQSEYPRKLP